MLKFMRSWKSACAGAAVLVVANAPVFAPQAQALPPWCIQWGWMNCDPLYARHSPEWQECFAFFYEECAGQPWGSAVGKQTAGVERVACVVDRRHKVQKIEA